MPCARQPSPPLTRVTRATTPLITLLLSWVGLGALTSCGARADTVEEGAERCRDAKHGYPSDRYLIGTGGGATDEEATGAARAELASQISAQLSSELTISASQAEDGEERQQVTQDLRVSSSFVHAELMRPLKACARCSDGACEATVTLDRDEAASRMIKELGPDVERLRSALQDLTLTSSLIAFTPAWHVARGAYERLRPQLNQLEVIGRVPRALADVDASIKRAQEVKASRLQRLSVLVKSLSARSADHAPLPPTQLTPLDAALRERFNAAIEQVGLKPLGQASCPTSTLEEVVVIEPRATLSCALGFVGPQCSLALSVELSLCPSEADPERRSIGAAEWSELKLVGVHPQDEAEAMKRLVTSITRKELTPQLARSLSPFVPF